MQTVDILEGKLADSNLGSRMKWASLLKQLITETTTVLLEMGGSLVTVQGDMRPGTVKIWEGLYCR